MDRRKLRAITADPAKAAAFAKLRYMSDQEPGISRYEDGGKFIYKKGNREITDQKTLSRIRSLAIPPAWKRVWICASEKGHLQATGYDARNRKQYRYHNDWSQLRNHTKFFRLHDFGNALPCMRQQLRKDLSQRGLPQEKVLAAVVSLMQSTCIRVGNYAYEKLNGSYGLTTLKDQHVAIQGQNMKFRFKGKKGVYHDISLKSKKLARIVQACKDIPGKELFQYYDDEGRHKSVDSGMVNQYIRTISGGNFTAKDFRTWAGTLHALKALVELGTTDKEGVLKKNILTMYDRVAKALNNTRAVCRKYYVHPVLVALYEQRLLSRIIKQLPPCSADHDLEPEEQMLLTLLQRHSSINLMTAA